MTNEVAEQVKTAAMQAFHAFKEEVSPILEKADAFDKAKFENMQKAIGDAVELAQKEAGARKALEDGQKAMQIELEALKTAFNRAPGDKPTFDEKAIRTKSRKAFNEFARVETRREMDFDDFIAEKYSNDAELKALSVGSDPDGGYLVQPTMGGIIQTKVYESSPMRQLASVQQIGGLSLEYVVDNDEAGSGWVGETATRSTTTTPTLAKLTITAHELYANPKATQTLLDDASIDMEEWLADKVAEKFARDEATAFITGSGIAKPRGIMSYTSGTTIASEQIEQVVSGSASAVTYDGLVNLQNALKEPYQRNASFLFRRATMASLLQLKDGEGRPIFNMDYSKNAGTPASLLGQPAYFAADVAAVGSNALAIAYGDFKQAYVIVDRIGLRVLRDPFTDKPYINFYTTKRVGGQVVNFEALKIQKIAAA